MDFKQAWQHMEKQGYRYGDSALENVRMGWDMAHGKHGIPTSLSSTPPEYLSALKKEDIKVNVFTKNEGWGSSKTYVGVTHTPSGLAITCGSERGQHANHSKVMKALTAAVQAVTPAQEKAPEKVTSVADLSLKEMHERCPGFGGCEAEPPKGWYCTREFHHNGPCNHLTIRPAKEACCVKGIMEPSGLCEDCKIESQGYSAAMGVTDDEKRQRAIEAWTKVAQKAGISLIGGKKFLCLDEDMCLELGLAFEALGWVHHEEG